MDDKATAMRQQLDKTFAGLSRKLIDLERHLSGTVRTVNDSVNTVRNTFDLKLQVSHRPWTLVLGAAALGFLGGFRPGNGGSTHTTPNNRGARSPQARGAMPECSCSYAKRTTNGSETSSMSVAPLPSRLTVAGDMFKPEITALRGMIMGVLFELVRDTITKQTPKNMGAPMKDSNNGSNGKLKR